MTVSFLAYILLPMDIVTVVHFSWWWILWKMDLNIPAKMIQIHTFRLEYGIVLDIHVLKVVSLFVLLCL